MNENEATKEVKEMAKATETVEVEETEEVKGMRPVDLAKELDIDPKRLRGWLRKEFARDPEKKNTSWYLTDEQVEAARERFIPVEDEGDESVEG